MAYFQQDFPWHSGEQQLHKILRVPDSENPTTPFLAPYAGHILARCPLLAVGTLDDEHRPWTTLWGGRPGFSRPIGQSSIGVTATVDRRYDPVVEALLGTKADGEVLKENGPGKMIGGLGIDLETRSRVKLYGRLAVSALTATEGDAGEAQLVVKIEQSLGNCPKYLNKKHITARIPAPKLVSSSLPLPPGAIHLLAKADNFYISSSNHESDMDTNHRGGPPGFVRVLSNEADNCVLIYPEYSGNRHYQTLGNLYTTPRAGLVFPDYDTGDVLYVTGTTEILVHDKASKLLPHSNVAIKITVSASRYVENGLPFRGSNGEFSPYNPPVRYLTSEQLHSLPSADKQITATLAAKKIITPTISRYTFNVSDPEKASQWKPGQYVAMDFSEELDQGYSHMRDNDPKSLNDDYLRTFTVSSSPEASGKSPRYDQFDITVRRIGPVTTFLSRQNPRAQLEVPLRGFAGDFIFTQGPGEHIACIAGGVGITPLLAQIPSLDLPRLRLYWTLRAEDLPLVLDVFEHSPALAQSTRLFVTGDARGGTASRAVAQLHDSHVSLATRRIVKDDLELESEWGHGVSRWYICTGDALKRTLDTWLKDRVVVSETFNY